ncbi:MAG: ATP-binding protein, partial [Psychroflexus maritimus]
MTMDGTYSEDSIRTLEWNEHIRLRPGMYVGKLGDGSQPDDGIYVLLKEVFDNSVDEFAMGNGRTIELNISEHKVSIRDYGRGIPLGKLVDVASKMNTGAKYDSKVFKKSVGLNGVGIKAVNALSTSFRIQSFREGKSKLVEFYRGKVVNQEDLDNQKDRNGTYVEFLPDESLFGEFNFQDEYIESMVRNYCYLNTGLTIKYNGESYISKNGLLDLLNELLSGQEL